MDVNVMDEHGMIALVLAAVNVYHARDEGERTTARTHTHTHTNTSARRRLAPGSRELATTGPVGTGEGRVGAALNPTWVFK